MMCPSLFCASSSKGLHTLNGKDKNGNGLKQFPICRTESEHKFERLRALAIYKLAFNHLFKLRSKSSSTLADHLMRSTIWRHLDERGGCDGHYVNIVDPSDIANIMY